MKNMEKILAGLLSLMMLSIPTMQVSAIGYDENGEMMGDIDIVIGSYIERYADGPFEYCYLSHGCIISPYEVSNDITLEYGDVIWVHASSIDPMWPGRYTEIIEIEYLGKADEYYGTTKELTVTNINEQSIELEDEQGMSYSFWFRILEEDVRYKSKFYIDDFRIGDKAIFVMNDKDHAVLPLEITYKAEQEDPTININPVPSDVVTGDANGDTELDILDVIMINKAVLGKEKFTEQQKKCADINGDGVVDADDSLILMKHIVGLVNILNLA